MARRLVIKAQGPVNGLTASQWRKGRSIARGPVNDMARGLVKSKAQGPVNGARASH